MDGVDRRIGVKSGGERRAWTARFPRGTLPPMAERGAARWLSANCRTI